MKDMTVNSQKYFVDWKKEFEEFQSSGQSMRSFCAGNSYTFSAFSYHYSKNQEVIGAQRTDELLPDGRYGSRREQNTANQWPGYSDW